MTTSLTFTNGCTKTFIPCVLHDKHTIFCSLVMPILVFVNNRCVGVFIGVFRVFIAVFCLMFVEVLPSVFIAVLFRVC